MIESDGEKKLKEFPIVKHYIDECKQDLCFSDCVIFENVHPANFDDVKILLKFLRDWTLGFSSFWATKVVPFFFLSFFSLNKLKYQNLFEKHPFQYWKETFNNVVFLLSLNHFKMVLYSRFFLFFFSFFAVVRLCFCMYFHFCVDFYLNPSTHQCCVRFRSNVSFIQSNNRIVWSKKETAKSYSIDLLCFWVRFYSPNNLIYTHALFFPFEWIFAINLLKYILLIFGIDTIFTEYYLL